MRNVAIRPMPYNSTGDENGRFQVYSYEITDKLPVEEDITNHGMHLELWIAEQIRNGVYRRQIKKNISYPQLTILRRF